MARVKRGVTTRAKHKRVLEQAKGYYGRRKNTIRIAKQAVEKAGQLQAVHELAVGQAFGAHRGVDPLDPQRAEAALLHLAVAVGVLAGLLDRLTGDADGVLAAAAIALGLVEQPLVLGAGGNPALDTCHVSVPRQLSP